MVSFIHIKLLIIKEKKKQKKKSNNSSFIFNAIIKAKLKDEFQFGFLLLTSTSYFQLGSSSGLDEQ